MRVDQVESIISRHHPDVKDWEGKKAELAVLAYLCKTEKEVLARIAHSSDDYRELLLMVDRIIESVEAEELVEFMVRMWQFREEKTETVIPGQVTRFIEENISQYNRAQIRALANFASFSEMQKFLKSKDFKVIADEEEVAKTWSERQAGQYSYPNNRIAELDWKVHEGGGKDLGIKSTRKDVVGTADQVLEKIIAGFGYIPSKEEIVEALKNPDPDQLERLLEAYDKRFENKSETPPLEASTEIESREEMARRIVDDIVKEHQITTIQEFRKLAMPYPKDMQRELVKTFTQVLTAANDHQKGAEDGEVKF